MTTSAALFFGTDLLGPAPELLRTLAAQGATLIPLDALALAWTLREGLPAVDWDRWLGEEGLAKARRLAPQYEAAWFAPAKRFFTFEGLCWPDFDREVLYAYWLSASVAQVLGEALAHSGVSKITVFRRDPPRPMLYMDPADTPATFWAGAFPGQVDSIVLTDPQPESAAAATPAAPPDFFLHDNLHQLRGKAAVCINPLEFLRFKQHITDIRAGFADQVVLVVNSHLARDVDPIARETGLPVLGQGPAGKPSMDVEGLCGQGFAELLRAHTGPLHNILQHNSAHFAALFRRWVWLQATREYWRRAFTAARPALVVVSNLEDSESQLPAAVAAELGIPSLCLTHGIGMTRIVRPKADMMLHQGTVDRQIYLRSGIPAERLAACRDLAIKNEYPVDEVKQWTPAKDKLNILVILTPTGHPGILYPAISLKAQVRGLRALAAPPADLAERVAALLKPHPCWPEREIVELAGPKALALLAPPDLSLTHTLAAADLVVALNYSGVGTLHCAEAGKPLVQLWLDPDLGHADPFLFADLYAPAGHMARSEEEFWSAVRRFLDEPGYAEGLRQRAQNFCREFHAGERQSVREIAVCAAGRESAATPAGPGG